jgi:hypothetical protein
MFSKPTSDRKRFTGSEEIVDPGDTSAENRQWDDTAIATDEDQREIMFA